MNPSRLSPVQYAAVRKLAGLPFDASLDISDATYRALERRAIVEKSRGGGWQLTALGYAEARKAATS
jgi:hypothetical protein